MDLLLTEAKNLKERFIEFVFEAEGGLASSLEKYVADRTRAKSQDIAHRDLVIDSFLAEGRVEEQSPIDLFLNSGEPLSDVERQLLLGWKRSFLGLFAVKQRLEDGFELMNWLTAKHYIVKPNNESSWEEMQRFQEEEIILTRISPITDQYWMFSGPCISMGRLGKPKLAVAIGNFKDQHKSQLYSDAPELLEQAWQSVEEYHHDFVEFFGQDEVTLPGYQLKKKIEEFQEFLTQKRLKTSGIDPNKSLEEMAQEAGMSAEELQEAAAESGMDESAIQKALKSPQASKMVAPKVDLPDHLKKAEQVTVLAHPRWGQIFLTDYTQLQSAVENGDTAEATQKRLNKYLEDPAINVFVWQKLAEKYPQQLEQVLRTVLERPDFSLSADFERLMAEFNKPIQPELPEIASVPIHLHNLFQDALMEVNKKAKSKSKPKSSKGFK